MSTLKIYGVAGSRAFRTIWMAKELGLAYEHVPVSFAGGATRTPEYLAVNPNGHIPAIDDGGLKLCESMAINLYLARKHGKLWPKTIEDEGRAFQWSFWVMLEVEKPLLAVLFNTVVYPADKRDAAVAAKALDELQKPFKVLDQALARSPWLAGSDFTVADLNVAAVLTWVKLARVDLSAYPKLADWLGRCLGRPACAETQKLQRAA